MRLQEIEHMKEKLKDFVYSFKSILGRSERVRQCEDYLCGLMMNGDRKSVEPMAKRIPGGNVQNMQQFVNQSPWDHEAVQMELLEKMKGLTGGGKGVLILDDTSFPKKGTKSVGVASQYSGLLGKIANCQIMVSWHYYGKTGHWPINAELYLPTEWTTDKERMKKAGVPRRRFRLIKRWEMALELLKKIRGRIPHEAIVFDGWFGIVRPFLKELDDLNELFVGRIPGSHTFWRDDVPLNEKRYLNGRPRKYTRVTDQRMRPFSARRWAEKLTGSKEWKTFRLPTKTEKYVTAIGIRVREAIRKTNTGLGPERWLIIEKYEQEQRYYVSNFPKNTSLKKMIYLYHKRSRIEQGYQQLKEELGMDHFEGRSWIGFHHHVTLSFMAYCFLHAMRMKNKKKHYITNPSANQAMDPYPFNRSAMSQVSSLDHQRPFNVF